VGFEGTVSEPKKRRWAVMVSSKTARTMRSWKKTQSH